jgi:hypothetical protein
VQSAPWVKFGALLDVIFSAAVLQNEVAAFLPTFLISTAVLTIFFKLMVVSFTSYIHFLLSSLIFYVFTIRPIKNLKIIIYFIIK